MTILNALYSLFGVFTGLLVLATIVTSVSDGIVKTRNLEMFEKIASSKYFKYVVIALIYVGLTQFTLGYFFESKVRQEVISKFRNYNSKTDKVFINGTRENGSSVVESIAAMKTPSGSSARTYGHDEIELTIKNNKIITKVLLKRSLQDSLQYGIYYQRYSSTEKTCIGYIKTDKLNNF
jgi:hypothetical protein